MLLWSDTVVLGDHHVGLEVAPAALRIEGSRISAVERCDREGFARFVTRHDPEGNEPVEDLSGRLLSPAFVNAHAHLPMAAFRGIGGALAMRDNVVENLFFALEQSLTDTDIRAFARLGAYESLAAGVAVVWEHYYGAGELVAGLDDVGIAAFVAPTLQDLDGPGREALDAQWQATLALNEDADRASRGLFAALGPHATDTVSPELWRRVADAAATHDLTIHAHVAQSIEELERAWERHGTSAAGFLARTGALSARFLLVHGIFLSEADLGLLDPARHTLGFCPFSQLQFSFPADVQAWHRAGVPWLVATDCAACNDGMGPQKELRFVAGMPALGTAGSTAQRRFRESGTLASAQALQQVRQDAFDAAPSWTTPEQLLHRVWSIPGSLDPRMPCGVIAPGAWAHLLTWDCSHPALWPASDLLRAVAFSEPRGALDGVMVAGRWRGRPGQLQADLLGDGAYAEARHEADTRLAQLLGRL